MEQKIDLDRAIEILEITDIEDVSEDSLSKIVRKAKRRWHPDKVAKLEDNAITEKYTKNFQLIEEAADLVMVYIDGGNFTSGTNDEYVRTEPENPADVIRRNANEIQEGINKIWATVKEKKHKFTEKEEVLSDGFSLKDLLIDDFNEDIAGLSIISLFFGFLSIIPISIIAGLISPFLSVIVSLFWVAHVIFCFLGTIPLSRFWLPESIQNIMLWFVNFGLISYNSITQRAGDKKINLWAWLAFKTPEFLAFFMRYTILFPLYELAKAYVGDKTVGVVKQKSQYYAGASEWYIDELISRDPNEMSDDELFDLSYLYTELSDVS